MYKIKSLEREADAYIEKLKFTYQKILLFSAFFIIYFGYEYFFIL